jgi:Zn-dependent protease
MTPESPLQRLRRLEQEDKAARAQSAVPAGTATQPKETKKRGILSGIIATILLVLSKGKVILLLLLTKGKLLLAAIKFGPLLTTLSTMGLAAWIYAGIFGKNLAIGIVLLILIHELGHGVAAKLMGLKVGAPIFIPFFGAVIALKEQPRSTWIEAVVGYGGPLAGTCGGIAVMLAGLVIEDPYWSKLFIVLAWLNFRINFFNLMPIFGLDGDRISQPFKPWYWLPGCIFVSALALIFIEADGRADPFIFFIIILGAVKGVRGWLETRKQAQGTGRLLDKLHEETKYTEESRVMPWQRRASAWAYFLLAGLLCGLMLYTEHIRMVTQ